MSIKTICATLDNHSVEYTVSNNEVHANDYYTKNGIVGVDVVIFDCNSTIQDIKNFLNY